MLSPSSRAASTCVDSGTAPRAVSTPLQERNGQPITGVVGRKKRVVITRLFPHKKVITSPDSSRESHGDQELLRVNKVPRDLLHAFSGAPTLHLDEQDRERLWCVHSALPTGRIHSN